MVGTEAALGRCLRGWHLLSLDAPTVVALWAWFLARGQGITPPRWAVPLLALATWVLYISDRILDGWTHERLRERHAFHYRHRRILIPLALASAAVLLGTAWTRLPALELRADLILGVAVLLYFGWVHAGAASRRWLPKGLAVAVIFALAAAIPAWTAAGRDRASLGLSVALFAAICWLNCVAIKRWERQPGVHGWTRWAGAHLHELTVALAGMALLALPLPAAAAVLVSALLLCCLDLSRERWTALQLRIAADAALLTPLLWLRH